MSYEIIILFILCFIVRAWPRILLPHAIASDGFFHLYYSHLIRKNKFRVPAIDERFLLNKNVDYPYFYHWLMSFPGTNARLFLERFVSAICDSLSCIILYLITNYVLKNEEVSLIVCILFIVAPSLFKNSDEPRVYHGSTRVFAQLLYFVFMFGWILSMNGNFIGIVISIFSGSLIYITTKFGIQTLLFFGIIISVFYPFHFLLIIVAFVLSIVLTQARSLKTLKLHFLHSRFLFKSNLFFQAFNFKRDISELYYALIAPLKALGEMNISKLLKTLFSPESSILKNFIAFHPYLILVNYKLAVSNPAFYVWACAGVMVFLLTKIPKLRFLGKPERYLEFSLPPVLILFYIGFLSLFPTYLLVFYLLMSLIFSFYYSTEFIQHNKAFNNSFLSDKIFFEKFNSVAEKGIIWTLHPFMYKPMYFTNFPILGYFGGTIDSQKQTAEEKKDIIDNYPFPSKELFSVVAKYGISYLITEKKYFFQYLKYSDIPYSDVLSRSSMIMENENYIIVKIA